MCAGILGYKVVPGMHATGACCPGCRKHGAPLVQGTPEAPRCGFSTRVVDALRAAGVRFGTFDILASDAVRQGLKALSDWPTYPQARRLSSLAAWL